MPFLLSSPTFSDGSPIPGKYTREGENLSPPLRWSGAPAGTRSYALVVEDPDAPNRVFRHWGLFNIPADRERLPESIETGPEASHVTPVANDFGNTQYDGPDPPAGGGVHHYHFHLVALDVPNLDIPAQAGMEALWAEARKHTLAEAELVGTYER